MIPYNGQLNQNLVLSGDIAGGLRNMLISQDIFDIKVAEPTLASRFKVDGTMFGDTKLYYSTAIGSPYVFASDESNLKPNRLMANLLDHNENHSTTCQSIKMGEYRQIAITIGKIFEKQAFMSEGGYSQAIGVLADTLNNAKKMYELALINSTVGTHVSSASAANITVAVPTTEEKEAGITFGQKIAAEVEILMATLENDNTVEYAELGYGYDRAYDKSQFIVVANVNQTTKVKKLDLPGLFHKEGLEIGSGMEIYNLPEKWFGTINTAAKVADADTRCAKAGWYNVSATTIAFVLDYAKATEAVKANCIYLKEGDKLPAIGKIKDAVRDIVVDNKGTTFPANTSYQIDSKVLFKLLDVRCLPYMSGFVFGSEFYFPNVDTRNLYLAWGHNKLEFLKEFPFITFKSA